MKVQIIEKPRLLSKDEATDLVGTPVLPKEPDLYEPAIIVDAETKEPIAANLPMNKASVEALRAAVLSIKYSTTRRLGAGGMQNASRTFGMQPRKAAHKRESCRSTSLAEENPEAHATLVGMSDVLAEQFREYFPDRYAADKQTIDNVNPEWRMTDEAMWTSGVVNKSSQLPYHRDGFNFDTWSVMPVIRKNMEGGYLHFPEFDVTVACRDGFTVNFCGHQWVHGVTPMKPTSGDAYRYSIVYYALRGMKDCFTYALETAQGAVKRTEREQGFVDYIVDGKVPANLASTLMNAQKRLADRNDR
jgi:hypothetical protein